MHACRRAMPPYKVVHLLLLVFVSTDSFDNLFCHVSKIVFCRLKSIYITLLVHNVQ